MGWLQLKLTLIEAHKSDPFGASHRTFPSEEFLPFRDHVLNFTDNTPSYGW